MPQPPNPTPIFRLVHADNLPVLLQRQSLHSPNHTPADGMAYRTIHRVEPLIHLVSTCQAVEDAGRPFVFADGHGLAHFTAWYDTLADPANVDWEAVYARQWNDTPEHMDRQRRKQAEFLVHQRCPWHLLTEIGVYNDAARLRVQGELNKVPQGDQIPVHVKPEWYY